MPPDTPAKLTVREIMSVDPVMASPSDPLQAVIRRMVDRQIGAVLVGTAGVVVGIFTERDLLRIAPDAPHGWRDSPVADWMTHDPHIIGPDVGWDEAAGLLERFNARHLPVVEHGRAVGILSARQLIAFRTEHLNRLVSERTRDLQQLTGEMAERERMTRQSQRVAGRLMNRLLLPGAPPDWPELAWAVHFRPLDPLGGDYYDFAQPDGRRLGVLIADASGHSLPAAMVAIMARIAFAEAAQETTSPAEVLRGMNQRLQELIEQQFVSAFYGLYDRVQRRLTYAAAGHPPPLHYDARAKRVRPLESRGLLLGIDTGAEYEEHAVELFPGDRLCLFTDGVTESKNPSGEPFGPVRLSAGLAAATGHADAMLKSLLAGLAEFRGGRPVADDETLLVAEFR
jgi:sigma-B regulation protein RsbU (phosphoserine phosphatase)